MEDIARLVDRILVLNKGKIQFFDTPSRIFKEAETLESIGLGIPQVSDLIRQLRKEVFQ